MSKEGILSILFVKKSRAKPPARRGYNAYASESDIHNSSIVNRHSSFHEVSYKRFRVHIKSEPIVLLVLKE
jgi:hypothetical protein